MNRTSYLSACLFGLVLAACNEKQVEAVVVTAETEPNDTFSTANNIGSVGTGSDAIDITASIEFDDGDNTDLVDHFLALPTFSGNVTVTVTPTDPAADLTLTEEISSSTDGTIFNDTGAGAAESGMLSVSENVAVRFRVECAAANTDYTVNVQEAPSVAAEAGDSEVPAIVFDPVTGHAQFEIDAR